MNLADGACRGAASEAGCTGTTANVGDGNCQGGHGDPVDPDGGTGCHGTTVNAGSGNCRGGDGHDG